MQAAQATLRQRLQVSISFTTFRDASRTGYAEAKFLLQLVRILVGDASCTGYAEAKAMSVMWFANTSRCKPHRLLCKAKANACRKAGNI